jgi:uncharacterized protein (DUF1684 family)
VRPPPHLIFVLVAATGLASAACNPKPPDETDYVSRITISRAEKDALLKSDPGLIPENSKDDFLPLEYYPIDPAYNVPAVLKPGDATKTILLTTSAGTQDEMREIGTIEFTLQGQQLKLTAFAPAADRSMASLFVPFRDGTSGSETYPGGRYLDLRRTPTGMYELDFNLAYNPNCYFSPMWICPYPPRENNLPLRIEAGERIKAGNHPA